jgi:hypothetical protein
MTLSTSVQVSVLPARQRRLRRKRRSHILPIVIGLLFAVSASASIAYLLWPTWQTQAASAPDRIPVSIGDTLFNVPAHAFRRKVQRHSGPQERIDLSYPYPSLEAAELPKRLSIEAFEETNELPQPADRIFLSIAAHHNAMSPDTRLRSIYPFYFEQTAAPAAEDGLTRRAFREGSAYGSEDLFVGGQQALIARCTRDSATPGMCLSERRIDGADLTFRFPREWLAQWRSVAAAMDKLTLQLTSARG